MILIINHVILKIIVNLKKKIIIIKVHYIISIYNNNTYYLKIIIKPLIYVIKCKYLSDINFYLDIINLDMHFSTNFVFLKTGKYSYFKFYSIYHLFSLFILYYYIK